MIDLGFWMLLAIAPWTGYLVNPYSPDPEIRIHELKQESEDLRMARAEMRRFWMKDIPSHLTPERVRGYIGIGELPNSLKLAKTEPGTLKFSVPFSSLSMKKSISQEDRAAVQGSVPRPNLLTAEDPVEATEALNLFLTGQGWKRMADLLHDPDTSLALQAAWELSLWSGDDKVPPHPQRFLGFLEGRTGVKVPLRWEYQLVQTGLLNSPERHSLQAAAAKEYLPLCDFLVNRKSTLDGGEVTYLWQAITKTNGTKVERKGGKFVFRVGREAVSIPEAVLTKNARMQKGVDVCAAHIGPERSFIAVYDDKGLGWSFPLLCVDSRSGELLWRAQVWGIRYNVGLQGIAFHDLNLVLTEKQIVVFGTALACYAEAFDVESGAPMFRFCTPMYSNDTGSWRRCLRR